MSIENRKHAVWQVVKFAMAFGLIAAVISEVTGESVGMLWKRISMPWFIVSVLAFYASIWAMARRYWVLIGAQIEFHDIFYFVLYQNIIGNLISTAAGAAWYVGMLRKEHNIQITKSVLSLVVARFGDLVTLLLSLVVATLVVWPRIPTLHLMALVVISFLTAVVLLCLLVMVFRRRLVAFAYGILNKYQLQQKSFVQKAFEVLRVLSDREPRAYRRSIGPFSVYSILTLGAMLLFAYASLQIFGIRFEIWPVIFVVALTQLISFVPIQVFGGLGLYDFTYLYLYGLFGVDRSEFATVVVGLRISYYLSNLALLPLFGITARSRKWSISEYQR